MIKPEIKQINTDTIYRYLGLQSGSPLLREEAGDLRLADQIERCRQTVLEASKIRCVYRILPMSLIGLDSAGPDSAGHDPSKSPEICLHGRDIARLLEGCDEAVLMALTLGVEVEKVLMRTEVTDMSDALVMDVCASSAVEAAADDFELQLSGELLPESRFLTNRFSPGYGDFELSHQRPILELLNASRAAGITLTPTSLMVPRKSVTAVMGICRRSREKVLGGCARCPLMSKCSYRSHNLRCFI